MCLEGRIAQLPIRLKLSQRPWEKENYGGFSCETQPNSAEENWQREGSNLRGVRSAAELCPTVSTPASVVIVVVRSGKDVCKNLPTRRFG